LPDAKPFPQPLLAVYPVPHGHDGKIRPIGFASGGIGAGGARAALATAQIVQGNHEKLSGIKGLPRTDTDVPPAGFAIFQAVITGGMMVAGKGMTHQNGIAAIGVEGAVGLIDQIIGIQALAPLQFQRSIEGHALRRHQSNRIAGERAGLGQGLRGVKGWHGLARAQ